MFSQTLAHGNSKNEIRHTDEEGKKRGVSMERSKAGTKERRPDGLSLPNQNTILINIIWYYFPRFGKSTINSINKKEKEKMFIQIKNIWYYNVDLNNRKMTNHPPSLDLPWNNVICKLRNQIYNSDSREKNTFIFDLKNIQQKGQRIQSQNNILK